MIMAVGAIDGPTGKELVKRTTLKAQ